MFRIMLDAGHYGKTNRSPCNKNYYESEMAWKLHLYLKAALEDRYDDIFVNVTRPDEEKDMPVYNRGAMAKGYDLFLSLHSNAVGSYVADGTDRPVIIYPIKNAEHQKQFAEGIAKVIRKVMDTKQAAQVMVRPYPNSKDVDYYGVIRGAVHVGCNQAYILEHSFHTDSRATEWLLDDINLRLLANAEADYIGEYFKLKRKDDEPMTKEEKAEFEALKRDVAILKANCGESYHKEDDIPSYYTHTHQMIKDGLIKGKAKDDLALSSQMIRETEFCGRLVDSKLGVKRK